MRKLINSLKYGTARTKLYLWTIILLFAAAAASAAAAVAMRVITLAAAALVLSAAALVVIHMASFTSVGGGFDSKAPRGKGSKGSPPRREEAAAEGRKQKDSDSTDQAGAEHPEGQEDEPQKTGEYREDYLSRYDKKYLKKLFKYSHVDEENVPILIDRCPSRRIRQCPAYVWRQKNHVCFLLLEESPRTVTATAQEMRRVTCQKGVSANPRTDYMTMKYSEEVDGQFGRLLPNYYKEGTYGKYTSRKNLYIIAGDMAITPLSLKSLMKMFSFEFDMTDSVLADHSFSESFREAYRYRLLFVDGVVSQKDYQEKIRQILLAMAEDMSITNYNFEKNLSQMVHYRLITEEYAQFIDARRSEFLAKGKKK